MGGHKPDLYAVLDVTATEIAEARVKEQKRQIPGYVLSCEITQFLLEEWIPSTPTPKDITLTTMKRIVGHHFEVNKYNKPAMFEIISKNVQKQGVKVWR